MLLTGLIGFLSGCSHSVSDEAIARDIQGKISSDPDTKDSQVSVAAKDGKVTLSGSVKSPAAQQKIDQIAHEETGASGVDDQTTIQAEQPKPQPIVIPAGRVLVVTTSQALSFKSSQAGQTLLRTLPQPASGGGRAALTKGAIGSGFVSAGIKKSKLKR